MLDPIHLLYLDAYHLGDPLYAGTLARLMARRTEALPPCLILHGSGDRAVRLFEAEGLFPEVAGGLVQPRTPDEAALVERALRQVNRQLVATLTDEIVYAVGFQGPDRGLLRVTAGGAVRAGRLGWLRDLVRQRVVPVLSALAREDDTGAVREVPLPAVALAVAEILGADDAVRVVFFTRNDAAGLVEEGESAAEQPLDAVPEALLPDPEALRAVVRAGISVLLTSPTGLFGGETALGTRIIIPKTAQKA